MAGDMIFACDYCHEYVLVSRAEMFYRPERELPDGSVLVRVGTYCGAYCGNLHASASVSGGVSG